MDGDIYESRTSDDGAELVLIAESKWPTSDSSRIGSSVFHERVGEREKPRTVLNAFTACDD